MWLSSVNWLQKKPCSVHELLRIWLKILRVLKMHSTKWKNTDIWSISLRITKLKWRKHKLIGWLLIIMSLSALNAQVLKESATMGVPLAMDKIKSIVVQWAQTVIVQAVDVIGINTLILTSSISRQWLRKSTACRQSSCKMKKQPKTWATHKYWSFLFVIDNCKWSTSTNRTQC